MYKYGSKESDCRYKVTIRQNEKAELIIYGEEWRHTSWKEYENWEQKNPTMTKAFKEDYMNKMKNPQELKPITSRFDILDLELRL